MSSDANKKLKEAILKALEIGIDGWRDSWKTRGTGPMGGFKEFITSNQPKPSDKAEGEDDE